MEQLILMIYKTHAGEWLTPAKVRAIASAIRGTDVLPGTVSKCINSLTKKFKLVPSKTASAWKALNG